MNSLRTDDILGAVPRIRHMPKNLFRSRYNDSIDQFRQQELNRSYNGQRITDQGGNSYNNRYEYGRGKWDQAYNDNMYGNYPLSQYDPNPFIKYRPKYPPITSQTSMYSNKMYDYERGRSLSQLNNYNQRYNKINQQGQSYKLRNQPPHYQQQKRPIRSMSRQLNNNSMMQNYKNEGIQDNQRKILPKQALVINYDQLKSMNLIQQMNKNTNKNNNSLERQENPQKITHRQDEKKQNDLSKKYKDDKQTNKKDKKHTQSSSSSSSSSSEEDKKANIKKEKNIFRGIGFNIITNSKYHYDLQTTNPYRKK